LFKTRSLLIVAAVITIVVCPTMAANLVFSDGFEENLDKWTEDGKPVRSELAVLTEVIAESGKKSLNLRFDPNVPDGVVIYAPEFDLPTGYVEVYLYDPTGDRNVWVDQTYLVVKGPEGSSAVIQMGMHGHHVNSANQTAYAYYVNADPIWFQPSTVPRSKGWHKFGVELLDGGVVKLYIDDQLQVEYKGSEWSKITRVGLMGYFTNRVREGAIGVPIHQAYYDSLAVYDVKP
jgi:hypothetical protein